MALFEQRYKKRILQKEKKTIDETINNDIMVDVLSKLAL